MRHLAEVEREIGVSRWTLYRWIKRGKLFALLLPSGHFVVSEDEVYRLRDDVGALGQMLPHEAAQYTLRQRTLSAENEYLSSQT